MVKRKETNGEKAREGCFSASSRWGAFLKITSDVGL